MARISYASLPKPRGAELLLPAAGVIALLIGWLISDIAGSRLFTYVFLLLALPAVIGFAIYIGRISRLDDDALRKFFTENAAANLSEEAMWAALPPCFGRLADRTDITEATVRDGYIFPLSDRQDCKTFIFDYTIQRGNRGYREVFTISTLEQARLFPHMFLDGRSNGSAYVYGPNQQLRLEGTFNKYFTLYVPKGSERDALTILTPDVMQKIIHDARPYDLEFLGNTIIFIAKDSQYNRAKLPLFFGAQQRLAAELNDGAAGSGSLDIPAALGSRLSPYELSGLQLAGLIAVSLLALAVVWYLS